MRFKSQSGRSLLEIIATLAIMGLFTLGSIAAFQAGMNSIRAKYIVEQVQLRVETVVSNTELSKAHKKMVYTPDYAAYDGEKDSGGNLRYGYSFATLNATQDEKTIAFKLQGAAALAPTVEIEVSGKITPGVCSSLKGKIAVLGNVNSATADGTDILKNACPDEEISKIKFVVKKNKTKKISYASASDKEKVAAGKSGSGTGSGSSSTKKCTIAHALSCDPFVCDEDNGYFEFEDEPGKCEPCPAGYYCS